MLFCHFVYGVLSKLDDDTEIHTGGKAFFRRTGLFQFVLDFVLVSGSEPWAFETHLENAKKRTTHLKSMGFSVWQAMRSNGLKWPKVDF